MMEYYDYILGLIPLVMGATATILGLLGVTMTLAIPAGALLAAVLIGHAMFVRAPVADETTPQTGAARSGHSSHAD